VVGESIFSNGTMLSSGLVQSANGIVGRLAGSDGNVILSGGFWQCSALTVGDFGRGTLTVADGGAVGVNSGAGTLNLAKSFVFSRGVLRIGDGAAPGMIQAAAIHGGVGEVASVIFNHSGNYTLGPALFGSLSVIKQNAGTTTLDKANGYDGATVLQAGRLILRNSGTNDAHSPIWNAGGADIQAGVLALNYTGLTLGNLTVALTLDALNTGYDQTPKFSSGQLRTSNPAHPNRGLGWVHLPAQSDVLVAYTLYGDTNLDFSVNIGDFATLAANFNQSSNWGGGDANYDEIVGIGDFALLAANFNQSLPIDVARGGAVPEPAGAMMATLGIAALGRRARSRC
jgi:T5SS/PEP-CTERM-associated repeat protein/autotransporter-associated beta strand protein